MSNRNTPNILNKSTIAKTRIFEIEQLDLEFSNGVTVQYERLRSGSGGAVLIIPMLDAETVLMIREYAAGVHRYELALPKGRIEKGEDPLTAANREIMEEVGYASRSLTHLTRFSIAPGYLTHETQIILAQDLYENRQPGDEPEEIEVVPWNINKLDELIQHPECTEARSIAALFIAKQALGL